MNREEIEGQYQGIVNLLMQQRLKEAQAQLGEILCKGRNWTLHNRLEQEQTTYGYMLQYMGQGIDDPKRRELFQQIRVATLGIADQARVSLLDEYSSRYYSSLRCREFRKRYDLAAMQRTLEAYQDELAVCQLTNEGQEGVLQRHEEAMRELFLSTWCNSEWTAEDREQAQRLLESETMYVNDVCLFTSAVTLSLMECFDARKAGWLLEAVTHADVEVNQRALVGIVIILLRYTSRMHLYPALTARLSLLDEDGNFGRQLNRVYIELLRSQETEKIDRKLREEIMPEMMKMHNMKFDIEENPDENDRNPEWEKLFDAPELKDKIREMSDLQMEGADLYMGTFTHFKKYPFFQEMLNWFYPFDMYRHRFIKELGWEAMQSTPFLPIFLQSGCFCNSDKYSLCILMSQMPQEHRTRLFNQMSTEGLQNMINENKETVRQHAQRPEIVCNQYVHDLYRFFKLSPHKGEFHDIFQDEIALHRIPVFKEMLCKPELLKAVAEFQFNKEHPAEAWELYQELTAMNEADAGIYQKAGYCLQKEKRYREAISSYLKADLLHPDNLWTNRHLATCYRLTRDFASALEYYKKIEAVQPENHQVLFYAGSCLAELGRYEEALQYFFKLDFMESDNVKAWRAIGWCLFLSGKHEQAMKYYEKILALAPMAADYLNVGHVVWAMGNVKQAAAFYKQSAEKCGNAETFRDMFEKDREVLTKQGIDEGDIPIMIDLA